MFIEIDAGFFDRIESNPIPPDGDFALFTGKLYGCVPVVFVTLVIIRIINMFCHVFCPHSVVTSFVKFGHFRIQHYHGSLSDPDKKMKKIEYFSMET